MEHDEAQYPSDIELINRLDTDNDLAKYNLLADEQENK